MKPISVFDAHCDTISRCCHLHEGLRSNSGQLSLERTSGFIRYCQFFALWADREAAEAKGCSMEDTYRTLLNCFQKQLACNSHTIVQCRTARDVELAHSRGQTAA